MRIRVNHWLHYTRILDPRIPSKEAINILKAFEPGLNLYLSPKKPTVFQWRLVIRNYLAENTTNIRVSYCGIF